MNKDDHEISDSPVDPYQGMSEQEILRIRYENKFNLVVFGMFEHVTNFYANDEITNAKKQLDEILMQCPDGPICCFLKYIYLKDEYRENLLDMNQAFFLDSGTVEQDPEVQKDREIIENIFKFKTVWSSFASDTKYFIMRSLKGLVKICDTYIRYL